MRERLTSVKVGRAQVLLLHRLDCFRMTWMIYTRQLRHTSQEYSITTMRKHMFTPLTFVFVGGVLQLAPHPFEFSLEWCEQAVKDKGLVRQ